jgi:hypothetical protein
LLSPSSLLDPPPSSSRHDLHLNLCCRRGGLILPGRYLRHVDCYVLECSLKQHRHD